MRANISEIIVKFMNEDAYKKMRSQELIRIFAKTKAERASLEKILLTLEETGVIIKDTKDRYALSEKSGFQKGIVHINPRGFGFISSSDLEEDVFVTKENLNYAMNNDEVLFKVIREKTATEKAEAFVKTVLTRNTHVVVGRFHKNTSFGFVIPNDNKMQYDIFIPKKMMNKASDGDIVVCRIIKYPGEGKKPEGMITDILGKERTLTIDIETELLQREIKTEFGVKVNKQVQLLPDKIEPEERKRRTIFTDKMVYTIDGKDAKDLDDAISVERIENNGYELGVYIADVSHYAKEHSPLDKEALYRGTSLYFADRVIPMLPPKLSNGLCSLNPNEEKLVLAVIMKYDNQGKLIETQVKEGIISSNFRLVYDDVSDYLENNVDPNAFHHSDELKSSLKLAEELSLLIRQNRVKRGSIDFDFPELYFEIEGDKVLSVKQRERRVANQIIEDFMIATNEAIAENFFMQDIPFLYREHGTPDPEKLSAIYRQVEKYNIFPKIHADKKIYPSDIQYLMDKINDLPEKDILGYNLLRAMQKAKYSPTNHEHFGLASKYYTHFTAPIRRYPDTQIHRIIKETVNGKMDADRINHYEKILSDVADRSSEMEVRADDLERTVDDILSCYYMQDHIGEIFKGKITNLTNYSMYVKLDNSIEGSIRYSDIIGDYYVYDEANMITVGEDSGKIFKFGEELTVRVEKVDFDFREVRLSIVE